MGWKGNELPFLGLQMTLADNLLIKRKESREGVGQNIDKEFS